MYKCNICNKIYNYISEYTRHIKRKTSCNSKTIEECVFKCVKCCKSYTTNGSLQRHLSISCNSDNNVSVTTPDITPINTATNISNNVVINTKNTKNSSNINHTCNHCDKTFSRKQNLQRHIDSRCKIKKQIDIHKNEEQQSIDQIAKDMKDMKNIVDKLQKENEQLKKTVNKKTINNNIKNIDKSTTNNVNSNNTVNIKIVANSKEDLSFLTNNDVYKMICRSSNAVPELIKKINFDKDRPENHNIYLPNFGSNTVFVHDGDKWMRSQLFEELDNIIDHGNNFISNIHDDLKDKYNDHQKNAVRGFDRYLKWYENDPKYKLKMFKRLKLVLFNYRDVTLETKKKIEQSKHDNKSIEEDMIQIMDIDNLTDDDIDNMSDADVEKLLNNNTSDLKNMSDVDIEKILNNNTSDIENIDIKKMLNVDKTQNPDTNDAESINDMIKTNPKLINEFVDEYSDNISYISNSDDDFIEDSEDSEKEKIEMKKEKS
jgi:hypothetical protein